METAAPAPNAEPPPASSRSFTLQRLGAARLASYSLLLLVGPAIAALFHTLLDLYGTEFNQQLNLVHHASGS